VRPFEGPSRAQYIIDRVRAVDLGAVHAPDDFGMDPILAVHDAGLVDFLQVAWDDWLAEGFKGEALADALGKVAGYGPDGLTISLGMDRFETDPISFFKLTRDDFTTDGADIAAANLPTLFVMEGGYDISEIGVNAVNVLQGFESAS